MLLSPINLTYIGSVVKIWGVVNSSLTLQTKEILFSIKKSRTSSSNHDDSRTSKPYLNLLSRFRIMDLKDSNPFILVKYGGSWISSIKVLSTRGSKALKSNDRGFVTSSSFFSCVIALGNFRVNLKSVGVFIFPSSNDKSGWYIIICRIYFNKIEKFRIM